MKNTQNTTFQKYQNSSGFKIAAFIFWNTIFNYFGTAFVMLTFESNLIYFK